jgi:hypothetical protein
MALALAALTGCGVAPVETPDPAAVPSGPLEAHGAEATGPVVELGSGVNAGLGWRYTIYPSDDGWCTQLEIVDHAASGCGGILPTGDDAFARVSHGDLLTGGVTSIEGFVTAQVATVWLLAADGRRMPAKLMPLEDAGLDGQVFLAFVPPDVTVTHLLAVARNGEVLDTYELP